MVFLFFLWNEWPFFVEIFLLERVNVFLLERDFDFFFSWRWLRFFFLESFFSSVFWFFVFQKKICAREIWFFSIERVLSLDSFFFKKKIERVCFFNERIEFFFLKEFNLLILIRKSCFLHRVKLKLLSSFHHYFFWFSLLRGLRLSLPRESQVLFLTRLFSRERKLSFFSWESWVLFSWRGLSFFCLERLKFFFVARDGSVFFLREEGLLLTPQSGCSCSSNTWIFSSWELFVFSFLIGSSFSYVSPVFLWRRR